MGVTNVALAKAIGRDESLVRKLLSDQSVGVVLVDFARHLVAWQELLAIHPEELVHVWAEAHGIAVEVSPRAETLTDTCSVRATGRALAAAGELASVVDDVMADGQVTPSEAARVRQAEDKVVRATRTAGAATRARAVR
jgi:hypothetical protein